MKVAVIHDWLIDFGGAEKVLKSIMNIYPDADVFTVVCAMSKDELSTLGINKPVTSTFIQRLPFGVKKYKTYLPLMPLAIQQLDLSEYDLIISSSYCVAKGVLTGPDQTHISYCHSPVRYAWDLQSQYLKESGIEKGLKSMLARLFLNRIRDFDVRSSFAVDYFISNSSFISRRIKKFYRRDSNIIFPPVDTSDFKLEENKEDYYVTCCRLVPYKKVGLIVDTFNQLPDKKLIVVGSGPEFETIKSKAKDNIEMIGFAKYQDLIKYIQKAKAFIYAAEEDFGIVPVEAQACGTPVIGFGKGGLLDTVIDQKTGIHFKHQTVESMLEAIELFESQTTLDSPKQISEHALQFSRERFEAELQNYINKCYNEGIVK
ncbi:glycosyltransferase [Marinicellulosiphila megalodicopiae]|uniref:glycosyltransferase n=1 Tax=Marinicellulosiphila megalodicopiae TaxID=2724896 RepID=UPI003BAF1F7C